MAPPKFERIAPVLGSRNVQKTVDYFTSVLGFECPAGVFAPSSDEPTGIYGIVRRDGTEIHIQIRRREIFAGERQSIEGDVYVFVDDADAVHAEVSARGAKVLRPPADQAYGLRDFVVEDPDGHRINFGSPVT